MSESATTEFVKRNPKLTGLICIAFCIVVSFALFRSGAEYARVMNVDDVQGTVTNVEKVKVKRGGTYLLEYSWNGLDGAQRDSRKSKGKYVRSLKPGQAISLAVDPKNPTKAIPRGLVDEMPLISLGPLCARNTIFIPLAFGVLGVLLILYGERWFRPPTTEDVDLED